MIVKCEQCQTRFKIPDDRVSEKGVKVRCSKCGHTFRIFRDDSVAAALPPAKPADPFAGFGVAPDLGDREETRPMMFDSGVEATRNADLKPLEPSFAAQRDLPRNAFESVTAIKPIPSPPPGRSPLRDSRDSGVASASKTGDFAALFEAAAKPAAPPKGFDPFAGLEQVGAQGHLPPAPPPNLGPFAELGPSAASSTALTEPRGRPVPTGSKANPNAINEPTEPRGRPVPAALAPQPDLFTPLPVPQPSELFGTSQGAATAMSLELNDAPPPPPLPKGHDPAAFAKTALNASARAATEAELPAWGSPPPSTTRKSQPIARVPITETKESAASGMSLPSSDDFFGNGAGGASGPGLSGLPPAPATIADKALLPDLGEEFGGLEAEAGARDQFFEMPSRPADPAPSQAAEAGPAIPLARISLAKMPASSVSQARLEAAGGPAADFEKPKPKLFGLVLNVSIALVMLLLVVVLGSIWLTDGKLDRTSFTSERVKQLFATSDWVAVDISNGLYETKGGRPLFFVRGEVENRGARAGKVKVRAELVEGDTLVRAQEVYAGSPPSPEQLWSVGKAEDVEDLSAKMLEQPDEVRPGQKAGFLVPFYEYPRDLKAFRVKVKVFEATPQHASR